MSAGPLKLKIFLQTNNLAQIFFWQRYSEKGRRHEQLQVVFRKALPQFWHSSCKDRSLLLSLKHGLYRRGHFYKKVK